ncbi:MAG: ComEC/Rec2 family competence protein [Clostridia bacterium]|nr:ComEC/Rec2 family competence protein [Clostridia bacterium]
MIAIAAVCIAITAILLAVRAKPYTILCVVLAALMVALSVGSSYFFFKKRDRLAEYYGTECSIEAMVVSTRYTTANLGGYQILVNKINGEECSHKATLNCMYDSVLEPGDTFAAKVSAESFDMISGSYSEELAMLSDGIFLSYTSSDPDDLLITDEDVFHVSILFANVNSAISRVFTTGFDEENGNLCSALLLGNKDALSNLTKRDFSRAGVSHILALSGMHMSVIMGALLFLMKRLRVNIKLSAVILIGCSLFYLFLTGCSVSAARAVIMLDFVYLSILLERRSDALTSLSAAGVILVLISPGTVVDAGFWMSFSSTLGLLVYMPAFNSFMNNLTAPLSNFKFLAKPIVAFFSALVAGVFAIIPLIAVMCVFVKELSLYSVISSAVLAIPTELLLILSLLYLPCAKIPYVSVFLVNITNRVSGFMLDFCGDISAKENIVISLNYPFMGIAVIVLLLTLAYSLIFKTKNLFRSLAPFTLALLLLFTAISVYRASEDDTVKVTYINASSKSDITVLSCDGEAIICDVGNGSKSSYRLAMSEVYDARATDIRAIMLTRYSYAHNAALRYVFESEKVYELWVPYPETQKEYHLLVPLKQIAEEYGVEVYVYQNGADFSVFEFTSIYVYRDSIERSAVPISIISISSRSERFMYLSSAFNELEIPDSISAMMTKTEYFVFGNRGPLTKAEYGIPTDNDAELIVFSDEIRAAYFNTEGVTNTTLIMAPEKCHIYITK